MSRNGYLACAILVLLSAGIICGIVIGVVWR